MSKCQYIGRYLPRSASSVRLLDASFPEVHKLKGRGLKALSCLKLKELARCYNAYAYIFLTPLFLRGDHKLAKKRRP
ncbi:MAG: hypothetical protein QXO94_01845 [Candidatus Bathyarchaeia archaeon]